MPRGVYERVPGARKGQGLGRKMPKETKDKIGQSNRAFWERNPDRRTQLSEEKKGVSMSDEAKRKMSEAQTGRKFSERHRRLLSEKHSGKFHGEEAKGYTYNKDGYRCLTGMQSHPLANSGLLLEHRKVLWDKIGPGPHACHWGCGRVLDWGGQAGLHGDHVDGDKLNNTAENIVPSCLSCNRRRALAGNPKDWHG